MLTLLKGSQPGLGSTEQRAPAGEQATDEPYVIGRGLKVTGNVETEGTLQIDGEVHGEISASVVRVNERACVTGGIDAEEIIVSGKVMGTMRGKRILLEATCRVEADIFHETLVIEEGAEFQGRFMRSGKAP